MEIYKKLDNIKPLKKSVITIGSYDGLHRGHFHIINRLQSIARSTNSKSVVITFEPHPRHVVNSDDRKLKLIMSQDRKIEILKKLDVDILIILEFNKTFMKITAENFMKDFLIQYFNPKYIVAGKNHSFGYKRQGDSNFLIDFCKQNKIELEIVNPIKDGQVFISSTNIRKLIQNGL